MTPQGLVNRAGPGFVALETTLPILGVPRARGRELCAELGAACQDAGAPAAFTGVVGGRPTVGLSPAELAALFEAPSVTKVNSANLGLVMHRGGNGATTVSTTIELAAGAGVRVAATGGLGGVHHGLADRLDVSADLAALARYPVALVASGVKSLLDVESTREALEALGVPVVGFGTDRFPAFYLRESAATVDERFDDSDDLAAFLASELARSGRAIMVAQPVPASAALSPDDWYRWLKQANERVRDVTGRAVTPAILTALHEISGGATLRANIALALANARLAGRLCRRMAARSA